MRFTHTSFWTTETKFRYPNARCHFDVLDTEGVSCQDRRRRNRDGRTEPAAQQRAAHARGGILCDMDDRVFRLALRGSIPAANPQALRVPEVHHDVGTAETPAMLPPKRRDQQSNKIQDRSHRAPAPLTSNPGMS